MSFNIILKRLAEAANATGAVLLAWDGEIVDSYSQSPIELDLIGAHHGIVLNIIKDAASRSHSDAVRYVSISTEKARLLIFSLKDGYYLVVTLGRSGYIGKVLRESDKAVKALEAEMG